jgi:sigma-B regulation protein RsbU (phosphoserine phosphatase)
VGRCFPARSTRGDHYDFFELPDRKVGLALSDVAGQGMAASLLMASVGNLLREQGPTASSLPEMLQRINQHLRASSQEPRPCSLFYAVYDDASRRLVYANAGHTPPLLLTEQGAQFLDSTGPVLGLLPEVAHQTRTISLQPGAILLIYSDGVAETRSSRGETYGRERLTLAVAAAREADAERLLARVLGDIRDFEGGSALEDDQTLVLLKVNPS